MRGLEKKAVGSVPGFNWNVHSPDWTPPTWSSSSDRVYTPPPPDPEAIDSRVVAGLEANLPALKKDLGLKNLDIKRTGLLDSELQKFRQRDAASAGVFSNYDRDAGKTWGFRPFGEEIFSLDVPEGLQWAAAAGNRVGNTVGSLLGNVAHSAGQTGSRTYDSFAQENPTIYVYPDGSYELYDTGTHAQEALGHGVLTAANVLTAGGAGSVIGIGVSAGAGKVSGLVGQGLAKRLSAGTLANLNKYIAAPVANAASKPISKAVGNNVAAASPALVGYPIGNKILEDSQEDLAKGPAFINSRFESGAYDPPQPLVQGSSVQDSSQPLPLVGDSSGSPPPPKWLLPLLLGGGGLAAWALMRDNKEDEAKKRRLAEIRARQEAEREEEERARRRSGFLR